MDTEMLVRCGVGLVCAGFIFYKLPPPRSEKEDPRGYIVIGTFFLGYCFFVHILAIFLLLSIGFFLPRVMGIVAREWSSNVFTISNNSPSNNLLEGRTNEQPKAIDILRERFKR